MFWSRSKPSHRGRELCEAGALLLDVRTPKEFQGGHIQGAVNIPVQELPNRVADVGDPARPVVVYCQSGGRSARAAGILQQAGYQVEDIGPMSAW